MASSLTPRITASTFFGHVSSHAGDTLGWARELDTVSDSIETCNLDALIHDVDPPRSKICRLRGLNVEFLQKGPNLKKKWVALGPQIKVFLVFEESNLFIFDQIYTKIY